jgi:hypothetical protein
MGRKLLGEAFDAVGFELRIQDPTVRLLRN